MHPQAVKTPCYLYVCEGMHPLQSNIDNLTSSPDGLTSTTASLFAVGGDFSVGKNKCRNLIFLTAANRCVGTVSTDIVVTSFFTSNLGIRGTERLRISRVRPVNGITASVLRPALF